MRTYLVTVILVLLFSSVCFGSLNKSLLRKKNYWKQKLLHSANSASARRLLPSDQESYFTVPQIIEHRGYPVEVHKVTTEDGYILQMHRIPPKQSPRKVVFLQHGVLESSANWVMNPSSRALAFLLADIGYDVWMGNNRGNRYSRDHDTLNPSGARFWIYSWDEYGNFDIPAMVNYILSKTSQSKLIYTGHSLGCGQFWIAMIKHPELIPKIDLMVALAPLSSFQHFTGPLSLFLPLYRPIAFFLRLMGTRFILDVNQGLLRQALRITCEQTYVQARICRLLLMLVIGPNKQNTDLRLIPIVDSNLFSGTSVNVLVQFAQNYFAGEVFQAYDYGRKGNLQRYNTITPYVYDLTKVTVPVYVFAGSNDWIVAPKDIAWLESVLGNLKEAITIEGYNHMDFILGTDVKEKVYDKIIALLPPPY